MSVGIVVHKICEYLAKNYGFSPSAYNSLTYSIVRKLMSVNFWKKTHDIFGP